MSPEASPPSSPPSPAPDVAADLATRKDVPQSQGRFEAAFNQSLVGMSIVDPEGRVVEINDAFCRMVGRSREELVGRTSFDYTHPDDRARTAGIVGEALRRGGERSVVEKRYLRPDGKVVWARLSLSAAERDGAGNALRLVGIIEDLTASKQANETIRSSEAWLRQVFESVADYAIFTLDLDGRVTSWNAGAQRLFGYAEDEILGLDSALLWPADDRTAGLPAQARRAAKSALCRLEDPGAVEAALTRLWLH